MKKHGVTKLPDLAKSVRKSDMVSPSALVKSEFQHVFEKVTKGFLSKYSPLKKLLGYVIRDRK